jgi:ferric-dicitrate binding protein FerR (iron transport regulator)
MMTLEQFSAALDRFGGDLSRWPPPLRQEAETLIAADPLAARELDRAQQLESLLGEIAAPEPVDAALIGRIVSRNRGRRDKMVLRPTGRLIGWASAAMVATLAIGFVVGTAIPADQSSDAIAALLFSGADEDIGGGLL